MTEGLHVLCVTAACVAFVHTLLGPDHYVPFLAMSRAGRWSLRKTITVTMLCGLGHVLSSVVVGLVGIAFGLGVLTLEIVDAFRAEVAGWLLLGFGCVYFALGLRRAARHRAHVHYHAHADGVVHSHEHVHTRGHVHVHAPGDDVSDNPSRPHNLTPWILFTIFVFGPCEVLIPLLMYPAATGTMWGVVWVTLAFGLTTVVTMTAVVVGAQFIVSPITVGRLARYGHALAGFALILCGLTMRAGW